MTRSVILFDLDGTLVDSAQDIANALTRLSLARGGDVVTPEAVRPLVSLGAETLVTRALGLVADNPPDDLIAFRAMLRDAPSDPSIVYPDVEKVLKTLIERGWRLAVVTNKPQSLATALLQTHGLDYLFSVVVGGDTTAKPKPDPAPLRHALTALDQTPGNALFVGDSAVDAAAAAALSIPLLLYTAGYGAAEVPNEQAAARFDAFIDLPDTVASFG